MEDKAYLILENGMIFEGRYFGARGEVTGEIVFTTGMTGYLETLTDQSYYGQIVLQTFPLIGNYGVIPQDFESPDIGASAYIVKYPCQNPSNYRSEGDIDTFLKSKNVIGLCDIDTRALTKVIRDHGTMNGKITDCLPAEEEIEEIKSYKIKDALRQVSGKEISCQNEKYFLDAAKYRVALLDFGMKENIKRELLIRNCEVSVFPYDSTPKDILKIKPDGIMLSNGPGNPADHVEVIKNLQEIMVTGIPVFGICLGHQLLALANGFRTHKLKYGHRGANQPVKDIKSGNVYITSQNHGYAVISESIDSREGEEWFINVNDNTCEGIYYRKINAFTVQFHPEACSGPLDTTILFDKFIGKMEVYQNATRYKN